MLQIFRPRNTLLTFSKYSNSHFSKHSNHFFTMSAFNAICNATVTTIEATLLNLKAKHGDREAWKNAVIVINETTVSLVCYYSISGVLTRVSGPCSQCLSTGLHRSEHYHCGRSICASDERCPVEQGLAAVWVGRIPSGQYLPACMVYQGQRPTPECT